MVALRTIKKDESGNGGAGTDRGKNFWLSWLSRPRHKGGQAEKDAGQKTFLANQENDEQDPFFSQRKNVRDLVAPNGVNPIPLEYLELDDGGRKVCQMNLYIDKMPKKGVFASTFATLFNFEDVTTNVFINPLSKSTAVKKLDKRVLVLDSERIGAEKNGDRNRVRKIVDKLHDAEGWARDIDNGDNALYEVSFLFTVISDDLPKLKMKVNDLHGKAKEKGIDLLSCYACQPEACVSALPLNRTFKPGIGPVTEDVIKKHIMDRYSLATIFNHTRADFTHEDGIIAGRNMHNGQPFVFDIYNPSHNGYGIVIAGKTGTGKSALIKMYASRYFDFGYKMISVDYESRGTRGEYAPMAEKVGGISFQIGSKSKNILNFFDVSEELIYDENTGMEYRELRLADKVTDAGNILMTLARGQKKQPGFEEETYMREILNDVVSGLYRKRGILEGEPNSLYENGNIVTADGRFTSGLRKKEMPTLHECYMDILKGEKERNDEFHARAYAMLKSSLKAYVKELYYCQSCLREYTAEEFHSLTGREIALGKQGRTACACESCKGKVAALRGTKSYYDGQSNLTADMGTLMVNIDISQLPETDKPTAQIIAMSYLQENYIKRNSMNPKKLSKLIFLVDELHKSFPYPEARKLVSDVYRTARKRHVSPWSATQAYKDYDGYEETEAIVKNAAASILFKQDPKDQEFLRKNTVLTASQIDELLAIGGDPDDKSESQDIHKGEYCIICNNKVNFIKNDYLKTSEAYIVETNVENVRDLLGKGA